MGIKDNVCVAGVPMMNGASVLEVYVPEVNATVAGRILDAGGEIAGKAACEHLCFSGASHINLTGLPVGLQLIGGHFDEATIYRAAHAYEQSVDRKTL